MFASAKGGGKGIGKIRCGKGVKILAIVDRYGLPLSVSTHAANHLDGVAQAILREVLMLKSIALMVLPNRILKFLKQIHYFHALKRFSERDEPDLRVVRKLVRSGDHVVDVGANVGWYTRVLAESVGSGGRVYSIEPIEVTFEILSYCIHRLGLRNVVLLHSGISEADGEAVMEIPSFNKGGDNFYRAKIVSGANPSEFNRQVQVRLTTLDKILGGTKNPIAFIKCDVEGHELAVVRGARSVIERFMPAWQIEVSQDPDEPGTPSNELFAILYSYGYSAFWFDGSNLVERAPKDKSINYFFLKAEQRSAFQDSQ
jgi:FkbM family methyltransferase